VKPTKPKRDGSREETMMAFNRETLNDPDLCDLCDARAKWDIELSDGCQLQVCTRHSRLREYAGIATRAEAQRLERIKSSPQALEALKDYQRRHQVSSYAAVAAIGVELDPGAEA
jgi:hypothetical protein